MLEPDKQRQLDLAKEQLSRLMDRFACASVIDHAGFDCFQVTLGSLVESFRHLWLLPKDFLSLIRSAQWQLLDGANHSDDPHFIRQQAAFLERAFDALLSGESLEDRRPDIPRII